MSKDRSTEDPVELHRWDGYVDKIGEETVTVMLADMTVDQGDAREIGKFPSHLLSHLDIFEGMFICVRIMSDERIEIEPVLRTEQDRRYSEAKVEELLDLLRRLRDDTD